MSDIFERVLNQFSNHMEPGLHKHRFPAKGNGNH